MLQNQDMVLEALLHAGKENAPEVPEHILRKVYEIQVKYQFEKDRQLSLNEMAKVVEDYINSCHDYEVKQ